MTICFYRATVWSARNYGSDWEKMASKQLLQATFSGDEQAVARGIDVAHDEHTSILSYNNENSQ